MVNKSDIDKKLTSIDKKATLNKTKHIEADKKLVDLRKKSCINIRKWIWFFVR